MPAQGGIRGGVADYPYLCWDRPFCPARGGGSPIGIRVSVAYTQQSVRRGRAPGWRGGLSLERVRFLTDDGPQDRLRSIEGERLDAPIMISECDGEFVPRQVQPVARPDGAEGVVIEFDRYERPVLQS